MQVEINHNLSVRELAEPDIDLLALYWSGSDPDFLKAMGVELSKMPTREEFKQMLNGQLKTPVEERNAYCIIWEVDSEPIGHSNTNPTEFGKEAFMHLHIWDRKYRGKGYGVELVKLTLPQFFNTLKLDRLYSEPYALNPAPNKTLSKVGFELEREYITTPGFINFEQPVKRWKMSRERFINLQ